MNGDALLTLECIKNQVSKNNQVSIFIPCENIIGCFRFLFFDLNQVDLNQPTLAVSERGKGLERNIMAKIIHFCQLKRKLIEVNANISLGNQQRYVTTLQQLFHYLHPST